MAKCGVSIIICESLLAWFTRSLAAGGYDAAQKLVVQK